MVPNGPFKFITHEMKTEEVAGAEREARRLARREKFIGWVSIGNFSIQ